MQLLGIDGYTRDQVIERLHSSGRRIKFSYDLLDKENNFLNKLDGVISCKIDHNSLATNIKRTARMHLRDLGGIDYLNSRIRPWMHLDMGGTWIGWPLGIFLISTPFRRFDGVGQDRDIELYDQLIILLEDKEEDRFVVDEGANYVDVIKDIISSAGISSSHITQSPLTLPSARDWPPGTPKLRIINSLLTTINYGSLSFSSSGVAVSRPYQSPSERPTGYTYEVNNKSLLSPEISTEFDLFSIANRWVVTVSEPDREPLLSSYTNDSPSSPTSTVSRGRTIVDFREVESATQASLDEFVSRIAFEASQVYERVEFNTALMPHHEHDEVLRLTYPQAGIAGRFTEHKWTMELEAGGIMSHLGRRIITI